MLETIECEISQLADRAFLRVSGADRTRWLNGMVTNAVAALQPGQGCYNFLLNAQGRIQGDAMIFRDPDDAAEELLIETTRDQVAAIQQHLDRFIIMDDVELMPVMDDQRGLLVVGPAAASKLRACGVTLPAAAASATLSGMTRCALGQQPLLVIAAAASSDVPHFEVFGAAEAIDGLSIALATQGAQPADAQRIEQRRIRSGVPRFGIDIRDRDLPQETAQDERALHFSKGCYLGQEIVERIHARGQVHRILTRLTLRGDTPAALPAPLLAEDKPAGEVTSVAFPHALGYVRREALERKSPLTYAGGTATASI